MGPNDGVFLKRGPSKADQNCAFWCDKPIWLPFRRDNPVNAARELVEQELMFPVRGVGRSDVPLFSDEKGQPFSKRQIATSFNAMLRLVVPASDLKKFSFHGYRIYVACALDAAQCPPDKINRILRWISDESLRTYVRDGEQIYTKWLDKARLSVINTVQVLNLPSLAVLADCPVSDEEDADSDYESDTAGPRPVVVRDNESIMLAGPARAVRLPLQI